MRIDVVDGEGFRAKIERISLAHPELSVKAIEEIVMELETEASFEYVFG